MKLVYLGSPDAAVEPLSALVAAGHDVMLVVSQPDRKRGRGGALLASPVKAAALALGIPVTDDLTEIPNAASRGAELAVVVAYGKLIRQPLLETLPFVNLHFSLLPRWRGAAPVERAILAGDRETGVCLMGLEPGLDTGPVFDRVSTQIASDDDLISLRARLVSLGTTMLITRLSEGFSSLGSPEPQVGDFTYAAKLDPSEFQIDWTKSAEHVVRLVRLGTAWTTFRGRRLKVLVARTVPQDFPPKSSFPGRTINGNSVWSGDQLIELVTVQPEGKAPMSAQSWCNGAQPTENDVMGQ
jgi:methionyl-tRNA formyltransferase